MAGAAGAGSAAGADAAGFFDELASKSFSRLSRSFCAIAVAATIIAVQKAPKRAVFFFMLI